MKIFDLTRGKYPDLYNPADAWKYAEGVREMASFSDSFQQLFQTPKRNAESLLNDIPVFLVESSMAHEYIAVPKCGCSVRVPADNYVSMGQLEDFDIDKWVNEKEAGQDIDPRERPQIGYSISDYLGVYVYNTDQDVIPRKVFIWIDKIKDYAEKNSNDDKDTVDNARTLFHLVLFHEMAHGLMDVELYGLHPSPKFSYANDLPYHFYEEAYANGIALAIILDRVKIFKPQPQQEAFIESFVKSQGPGYSDGWILLQGHPNLPIKIKWLDLLQWMGIKVLFNFDTACLIREMWEHRPLIYHILEGVGRDGWIAVKDRYDKRGFLDVSSLKMVDGFKSYDIIRSFDENGLCKVRLDQQKRHLYGYVNEQGDEQIPVEYEHLFSFENGIAIAKRDGSYGAIDLNNNTVIPFDLPYEDVRGFRNGRAAVKNHQGKWGMIDTSGKEIVPCTHEHIV